MKEEDLETAKRLLPVVKQFIEAVERACQGESLSLVTDSSGDAPPKGNVLPFRRKSDPEAVGPFHPLPEKTQLETDLLESLKAMGAETKAKPVVQVDPRLLVLQERLVRVIDENYEPLHDSIDKLGCKGDCYRCPHPDFTTVGEQVESCLVGAVEGLDLDRSLLNT